MQAAPAAGRVLVLLPGKTSADLLPCVRGLQASVGDVALIVQGCVVGLLGTSPAPAAPAKIAPGDVPAVSVEMLSMVSGSTVVWPSWTGTWQAGDWRTDTSDLVQGDQGTGAQTGVAVLDGMDALGSLVSAAVHFQRDALVGVLGAADVTVVLIGSEPGEVPATLAAMQGPTLEVGGSSDWAVPYQWLVQMQSGAATGIGIRADAGPVLALVGSELWVTVEWRRG